MGTKPIALLAMLLTVFVGGCDHTKTYDLTGMGAKVSSGMSELQVTAALGAPSKIEEQGETRDLIYKAESGDFLQVTLKGNVVVSVLEHD